MTWGFYTPTHIISLFVGALIIVGLYFALKKRSDRVKIAVLFVLSFSGTAAVIYNLVTWGSPLEYLPLHLCSISAAVLPFAVITRNKVLNNLLLLWSFGALFALLVNTAVAEASIFSPVFAFFYFPHVLEFGIPILMFKFGLTKKDIRCIGSTLIITVLTYTAIHFVNLFINSYAVKHNIVDSSSNVIKVNYMYSITPENPLLALFYKIIPYQYWYMYLSFVIVIIYLSIVYSPEIAALIKNRRKKKLN